MKVDHYLKKVEKSEDFKKFKKQDSKAYLCSFFFIRDYEEKQNETQVDFYSPKTKMIVSFKVNGKVERIAVDKKAETITHKKFIPKPLKDKINLEIDVVKPTIIDEMHNRSMADEIKKILAVLHIMDDRVVWNCTCFLKGMGLLQAHVEDKNESVLFMEKKSFFDLLKFVKKVEPGKLGKENLNIKDLKKEIAKGSADVGELKKK